MRLLRKLARFVLETRSEDTVAGVERRDGIASWSCSGLTMRWHAKGMKLYHDAQPPHGMPASDEEKALQVLCGCHCVEAMGKAHAEAVNALRRLGTSEVERLYGRGSRNFARLGPRCWQANVERLDSNAQARWVDRIVRAVSARAEAIAGDAAGVTPGEGDVHLRIGPNGLGYWLKPTWIAQALASGLHDALTDLLIVAALPRRHTARCIALRFNKDLHAKQGSIHWEEDHYVQILQLECCRVDGQWVVQECNELSSVDLKLQIHRGWLSRDVQKGAEA
jgi:hypothetical protein